MSAREELTTRLEILDRDELKAKFLDQDEFLMIENFLPASILEKILADLPTLESHIHRNYIPTHKKGGSISRVVIDRLSPVIGEIYNTPAFFDLLKHLAGGDLLNWCSSGTATFTLMVYPVMRRFLIGSFSTR